MLTPAAFDDVRTPCKPRSTAVTSTTVPSSSRTRPVPPTARLSNPTGGCEYTLDLRSDGVSLNFAQIDS